MFIAQSYTFTSTSYDTQTRKSKYASFIAEKQKNTDVYTLAGLLKMFFRELPEPVIPSNVVTQLLLELSTSRNESSKITQISNCLSQMPYAHQATPTYYGHGHGTANA